jgi:hypothetical protein
MAGLVGWSLSSLLHAEQRGAWTARRGTISGASNQPESSGIGCTNGCEGV